MENKQLINPPVANGESEDSEDDKPLSAKLSARLPKGNSHVLKGLSSPVLQSQKTKVDVKKSDGDSEDEVPLSSKFPLKTYVRSSSGKSLGSKGLNSPSLSSHPPETKVGVKESSDDSEDEIPLLLKLQLKSRKGASSSKLLDSKGLSSPASSRSQSQKAKVNNKNLSDDSEDEIPLSSKFRLKTGMGASLDKLDNFDEKKPLTSTLKPNGISKKDDERVKSPKGQNKRPLGQANTSHHSSSKKPKLLDGSVKGKVKQVSVKAEQKDDDDDDNDDDDEYTPTVKRLKKSVSSDNKKASKTKVIPSSRKKATKKAKKSKKLAKSSKYSKSTKVPPNSGEGQKWTTLEHNGVIFPPPYKPHGVKMLYNGRPVDLTPEQEEVATMFAVMKDTDYATKPRFIENFMNDWRVRLGKNHVIKKFELCDFTPIYEWHEKEKEKKKQMTTEESISYRMIHCSLELSVFKVQNISSILETEFCEYILACLLLLKEKKALKEEKLKQEDKYMWAVVDGVKEKLFVPCIAHIFKIRWPHRDALIPFKVGNFRVEPPGLFRGRGEHPKMGKLKKRICPSDITINIGKEAPVPECPIPGERWKEVRHDNTVTWLAFWNDPINPKEFKYVFLAASSSLKGQSDKEKYEKARLLKDYIQNIRATYTKDFTNKDTMKRQIAVATYLIDKLALRAGNEKDDDEADTVGCCTLKVENVALVPPNKLEFDFLGKDSIRYFNTVEVELPVYKAIGQFKTGKSGGDDLFDKLDTSKLNAHLKELMPGLTAKVFRTYNASITLDEMIKGVWRVGNRQDDLEKLCSLREVALEVPYGKFWSVASGNRRESEILIMGRFMVGRSTFELTICKPL
ncbi:DNA topoisomerase 1 beta [Vitis vinifera]|uniref:DNA topoisomerase I n=1 Tax=Vitis vinifera TaxID=29760 RepID=A0A438DTX6_VITVI|nr:DNA topoisomerase 1 beta [Vitis vinifera]